MTSTLPGNLSSSLVVRWRSIDPFGNMQTLTLAQLFAMRLEHHPVPRHWLKALVPDVNDDDGIVAGMRTETGERPRWMGAGTDKRGDLLEQVSEIQEVVAAAQANELHLFRLLPDHGRAADTWRRTGLTRTGETLETWYSIGGFFQVHGGHLWGEYDIVIVRATITHATLLQVVPERVAT